MTISSTPPPKPRSKSRKRWLLFFITPMTVITVAWFWFSDPAWPENDPVYAGKPLLTWLCKTKTITGAETDEIVSRLKPADLPFIIFALERETTVSSYYRSFYTKFDIPDWLEKVLPYPRPSPSWQMTLIKDLFVRSGPELTNAVPVLLNLADYNHPYVQTLAIGLVGLIGSNAQGALPTLTRLARKSPFPETRNAAQKSIAMIQTPKNYQAFLWQEQFSEIHTNHFPLLVQVLQETLDPALKIKALKCLAILGADATPAIPQIEKLTHSLDPEIQRTALICLEMITNNPLTQFKKVP